MGVHAIDVSRWQGTINWRTVRDAGPKGVWIKVGGSDGGFYSDGRAASNLAGAAAAGLPYGTYYFAVPKWNDAQVQALHAVTCGYGRGQMWPALDLESNPHGLNQTQLDIWVRDFCDEAHHQLVRDSLWYGGKGTGVGYSANPPRCPIWVANYGDGRTPGIRPPNWIPGLPPAWAHYDVWQFNSITRVAGIPDNTTDQNVVTDDFWARMMAGPADAPPEGLMDDEQMKQFKQGVREVMAEPGGVLAAWLTDSRKFENLLVHDVRPGAGLPIHEGDQWWIVNGTWKKRILPEWAGWWMEQDDVRLPPSGADQHEGEYIARVDQCDEVSPGGSGISAVQLEAITTAMKAAFSGVVREAVGDEIAERMKE